VRVKSILVVLLIAVAGTTATPVTGQEEPLPAIVVKQSVFLAVEPVHGTAQPSLADAVRANDYPSFDALYREAVQRGESVGAYETLHELWTYSITDPIGAFYGDEMYERLARAYPGYAKFMEDFRIVDSNGNAFYPTSETRTFLLSEAFRCSRRLSLLPKLLLLLPWRLRRSLRRLSLPTMSGAAGFCCSSLVCLGSGFLC
jgi:hypothetical protein